MFTPSGPAGIFALYAPAGYNLGRIFLNEFVCVSTDVPETATWNADSRTYLSYRTSSSVLSFGPTSTPPTSALPLLQDP